MSSDVRRLMIVWGWAAPPLAVAEHAGGIDERSIEERVERIVEDLTANRVIPKQIDKLEEAVRRSRVSQDMFRATRNR